MPNTSDRKVTRLVIDRAKWGMSALLNYDGTMCCMGFLALKCGADETEIDEEGSPEYVPNINWPAAFIKVGQDKDSGKKVIKNSKLTDDAININDNENITWGEKERKLIPVFKKAGIKLSFKGPRHS